METAVAAAPYISAGMGLAGSMGQTSAQNRAANMQYQQSQINQELQGDRDAENRMSSEKMNSEERAYRERLLTMMKEGSNDPTTGVHVRYIPGQGQVTSYTPEASDLITANRREDLLRLIGDQAMSRRGRQANELTRFKEGAAASKTLGEMQAPDPYDSKRIIADLIKSRRRGVNEGFDKTTQAALMSDVRTGSNSGRTLAELARKRGESLSDAEAGGYSEGLGLGEDLRGARTQRLGNKYNLLASRAGNVEDVAFAPQQLSSSAQNISAGQKGYSSAGAPVLVSPRGREGAALFDGKYPVPGNNYSAYGEMVDFLGKRLAGSQKG